MGFLLTLRSFHFHKNIQNLPTFSLSPTYHKLLQQSLQKKQDRKQKGKKIQVLGNKVKSHTFTFPNVGPVYINTALTLRGIKILCCLIFMSLKLSAGQLPICSLQSVCTGRRKIFKNKIYHLYCTECLNGKRQANKCDIKTLKRESQRETNLNSSKKGKIILKNKGEGRGFLLETSA